MLAQVARRQHRRVLLRQLAGREVAEEGHDRDWLQELAGDLGRVLAEHQGWTRDGWKRPASRSSGSATPSHRPERRWSEEARGAARGP